MPLPAEPHGGQPLRELESAVVERRYDDALRRAIAPQSVFGEELRGFGGSLRSGLHGVVEKLRQAE